MQTIYKRFSVIFGFCLLLVVLLANAIVTRRQLAVQVENQAWVSHTQDVRFNLSQTESLLKDAETGQRGFLYTGDPQYLAPFNAAISQIDPRVDNLAQLTADNPRQQARILTLRSLTRRKIDELNQTLALYESGKTDAAKTLVQSNQGLATMDQIRALMDQMLHEEDALQATRLAASQNSIRVTVVCIYLATFIALMGAMLLAYYVLSEINLRERHARVTAQREEWFRTTLTSLGDGVIATDEKGRVTFLNLVAERLIGTEMQRALGMPIQDVFPIFNEYSLEPVENPVKKVMELGHVVGLANHTVLRHRNGSMTPIEDSAAPIRDDRERLVGVVLVFRDASQERRSQEIMRKTEKLAAAARLAATVAHEINNPLESISNLIYLAKSEPGLSSSVTAHLTLAEQELERVAHITRQTLGFYRESKVGDHIELAPLIESVLNVYANKFKTKNITIERDFAQCPAIRGRAGELKQVFANLISNAADAVSVDGTVRVILSCAGDSGSEVVQVTVEDDGPGIPDEHREKIFEPFFTTKANVGTGLGLWVVREIVDRHGGTINVDTRGNGTPSGTAFNVLLPQASADPSTTA